MTRVEPSGYKNKIMIVGINPGHRPMEKQDIWETDYGRFVEMILKEVGLDRTDVWMTNLFKWKTERNRQLSSMEQNEGMAELVDEIYDVNPKVIVTLGSMVAWQFGMEINHCKKWNGWQVYCIHHPSYVRRYWERNNLGKIYTDKFKEISKYYGKIRRDVQHATSVAK